MAPDGGDMNDRPGPAERPEDGQGFTFAVIADTHVNQGESLCNSPFEVNRLANARLRHVVRDLNARAVDFVLHLGDVVHPVPAFPDLYGQAVERFRELTAELRHPLYLVPGNHDVGDKPNGWAPAGVVSDAYLALWRGFFGQTYFAFGHKGCRFVVLDAQILNSGLSCEAEQRSWLEASLSGDARLFVALHYPPYLASPAEPEHYDNIAEPARGWLLNLLQDRGVEALFAGHVHNFWYDRYGATDLYLLPSTAFVRQDYSEAFRCPPDAADQAGRDDRGKLGYFLVHVQETGHSCEFVRTSGEVAAAGHQAAPCAARISPRHSFEKHRAPLGFDMRQSWLEEVEIPPTGGLDEFDRKAVRNDYALMALWEMGVRRLRIPLQDLRSGPARRRVRRLSERGMRFTLFSFGPPGDRDLGHVAEMRDVLASWEIAFHPAGLDDLVPWVCDTGAQLAIPIYLSRLQSREDLHEQGQRYYHVINHGYRLEDAAALRALKAHPGLGRAIDGFVFRLPSSAESWETILSVGRLAADLGTKASVHLRVAGANPALAASDDRRLARRLAEALMAALCCPEVSVFADTLADIDRGYFVRHGVVDRRYNPRLGARVLRHLYGALNIADGPAAALASDGGPAIGIGDAIHVLSMSDAQAGLSDLAARLGKGSCGRLRLTNLSSGVFEERDGQVGDAPASDLGGRPGAADPLLVSYYAPRAGDARDGETP